MCIVMCFYVLPQELYAQYQEYEVVTDGKGNRMEIDVPKSFTFEVDSLLELYHAKTYLKADSDCSMMNYDPETDRETFIERLRRMPTIMEMPYNEEVSVFIKDIPSTEENSLATCWEQPTSICQFSSRLLRFMDFHLN